MSLKTKLHSLERRLRIEQEEQETEYVLGWGASMIDMMRGTAVIRQIHMDSPEGRRLIREDKVEWDIIVDI